LRALDEEPSSVICRPSPYHFLGGRTIEGPAALAPDGRRLLVAVPQGGVALELHLITDWRHKIEGHSGS